MTNQTSPKILVALSGGTDSAVTAILLRNQGYNVIGIHIKVVSEEQHGDYSCGDATRARYICESQGFSYVEEDVSGVFSDKVVDYFVHQMLQQRYPSLAPVVQKEIIIKTLLEKAKKIGCEAIATGHYANITKDSISNLTRVYKASDKEMDQSYELFGLDQHALGKIITPLGSLTKVMVKRMAEEAGIEIPPHLTKKKWFCFLPQDKTIGEFISERSAAVLRHRGVIRTVDGYVVGEHEGLFNHPIGQKEGLQLTIRSVVAGSQLEQQQYVVGYEPIHQALIIGSEEDLMKKELMGSSVNWIKPIESIRGLRCKSKLSQEHEEVPCLVTSFENQVVNVKFDQPQRAIVPGQAIVFYDGDELLGGAFIDRVV